MKQTTTPTWLPPFKGAAHSFLDCEVLALRHVDPALSHSDWQATETIWFDYARLHPVKAFYHFANCYSEAYGRYLESNIDMDMRFSRGLKGDPIESRELKQLLAIKRVADRHGVPYQYWLGSLFNCYASNGWTRPPRPSHMASSQEFQQVAVEKWQERLAHMTVYAGDPWFSVDAWVGHPQQRRYESFLVECIKLRDNREGSIAAALYDIGQLRIERAIAEFPREVEQAQAFFFRLNK